MLPISNVPPPPPPPPFFISCSGVDFYAKVLQVEDKVISLQLWDTAGQERFQSVTKAYYRGAHGIILMYDIAQEESFVAVKTWINSIQVSPSPPSLPPSLEHGPHALKTTRAHTLFCLSPCSKVYQCCRQPCCLWGTSWTLMMLVRERY